MSVLKAYALLKPEIGYCQGMSNIAALFVSYCSPEDSFWMFECVLHDQRFDLQGMFEVGLPLVRQWLFIHDRLLERFCEPLFRHLSKLSINSDMYVMSWYLTLFTRFPTELCVRVWDIFLYEGRKIFFRLAIAILSHFQPKLITMDFEHVLTFFQKLMEQEWLHQANTVVKEALDVGLKNADLVALDVEYKAMRDLAK